jgi:hypothetical protein
MSFFDFSDEVEREIWEAKDDVSRRLCARTTIGRKRFPDAVTRAGFSLLTPGHPFSPSGWHHVLVIGVATCSDPDLSALEKLAVDSRGRDVKVLVFDIDDWSLKDILGKFPGVTTIRATPVVAQYRDEVLTFQGEGRDAMLWLDQF